MASERIKSNAKEQNTTSLSVYPVFAEVLLNNESHDKEEANRGSPVRFTVTNNNIKQMSPDSINRWKKRRNDGTRTHTFTDASTRRHVHTHTRSLERPKLLQMYCWSSLNVVVKIIIRALFVWSFMAIIVQQCDRGERNALSGTLCSIICSRSNSAFFNLNKQLPPAPPKNRWSLSTP